MAHVGWFRKRRTLATGAGVLLALLATSLPGPANAVPEVSADAPATACPAPLPLASVTDGMKGDGWTVVRGSTPERFEVEVLGVLPDGIGAGRDLILIKVSDRVGGHVVDQGGGIWAGMSGSPVYVDGKLLGAVSYGFTSSPSPIGGLTPAADMLDLLGLGSRAAALKAKQVVAPVRQVRLPATVRKELAVKSGEAAPRGTLQQLVTPLAVTGLGPKRVNRLQADANGARLNVKAYAAGRATGAATTTTAPTARPQAGGNFAAALSYGDVTVAGIGTTTAVCGDQALAFGHPMNLAGPVHYGASDAQALAIVQDNTLGSFKMANIAAPVGTVDQDRTAALRADLTTLPTMADVTTVIRNADTGKSRAGSTRVADPRSLPGLLPYAAWANYDSVFDEVGDGTATSDWTITGTRGGGMPFSLSRANQWASRAEVAIDPALDLAYAADALVNNETEDVTIDNVSFSSTVASRYEQLHITKMEVSVNGGRYSSARRLTVKVGAKLKIRVSLRPFHQTTTSTTTLTMTVPKSARGRSGELAAVGGVSLGQDLEDGSEGCLLAGGGCADPADVSLSSLMKAITSAPRNDAVVAQLLLQSDDEEASSVTAASSTRLQKLTVSGARSITLTVRR
ncbi:MAG: SpoIVB peptidase S55 domain-containing protein [Friedmanniella sp.]